ncbi:MAG TPA: metal-dependent hydrolase [Terracidiphilus sp.]|nr:metal-dependent hydrolase [Terracidiphilus sp.]
MEPLTHFLTGACIGRAGLNRKTAYATLAAVLAAEAADLDALWSFAGPVEGLKHHRGITHTFIAVPVVAAAVVGVVWLLDRWVQAWRRRKLAAATPRTVDPGAPGPRLPQPVHWGWLYGTALIAALSHLLLDWTNNYGLRPFSPFNPRWYAGSFVFIAEPVLWTLFFMALVPPWLFGLADAEIGARRAAFRGRGWAIFALTGMVLLLGWRWAEQGQARAMVENAQITTAPVKRMALEPYQVNPFRWHAILETADFYQTAEIDTLSGSIDSDPQKNVIFKPRATAATEAAKRTLLGQVYLDWGTWALVRDVGQMPVAGMAPPQLPPNRQWTTVEFTDLRWDYSYLGAGRVKARNPLAGWVYIVDGRDDAGEAMNGREQR